MVFKPMWFFQDGDDNDSDKMEVGAEDIFGEDLGDIRSGHWLNFFRFPFLKKIIDLPGGLTGRQNTILFCSSQQLPRLRLGPLKGFLGWQGAL